MPTAERLDHDDAQTRDRLRYRAEQLAQRLVTRLDALPHSTETLSRIERHLAAAVGASVAERGSPDR